MTCDDRILHARQALEDRWRGDEAVSDIERWLCSHLGCSNREASILVAERAAADRLRARGLDPAGARIAADALLVRPARLVAHLTPDLTHHR